MLACGYKRGPLQVVQLPVDAAEQFAKNSGKFVQTDASGNQVIAVSDATNLLGYAFVSDTKLSGAVAGAESIPVNISPDAEYIMPACKAGPAAVTEANLKACVGKMCDILVDSGVQYADVSSGTQGVLIITGYVYEGATLGQQFVTVKMNPAKQVYAACAIA